MNYAVGDLVTYSPFGVGTRTVRITERDVDIKNGYPGFSGVVTYNVGDATKPGDLAWGYDDQITAVG